MDNRLGGAGEVFHQPGQAAERLGHPVDIERREDIELKRQHRKGETATAAARSGAGLCPGPAKGTGGVDSAIGEGAGRPARDGYRQESDVRNVKYAYRGSL